MSRMLNGLFVIEVQALQYMVVFMAQRLCCGCDGHMTYDRSELAILVTKTENENGLLHLKVHFDKPFR
jgi:hypothetical protein